MTIAWLPWVVIAVGVASLFVRARTVSESAARANPVSLILVAVLMLASLFGLTRIGSDGTDLMPTVYGAAIGAIVGLLLATVFDKFASQAVSAVGFGFGALVIAGTHFGLASAFKPEQMPFLIFGIALGFGGMAWGAGGSSAAPTLGGAALATAVIATVDELGRRGPGNLASQGGTAFALVAMICATLTLGLLENDEKKRKLAPVVMALLMAGGAWLISTRVLALPDTWLVFALGAGAAVVVHYLLPEDDKGSFGFMLATMIWLGLATLSFGMGKGFGMAVATLGAVPVCLAMRNGRALLSMGPLFGLILYRVFRELFTDSSRALDIGQHYGLVGLLVGACVPLLAWEWWQSTEGRKDMGRSMAAALWTVILVAVPMLVVMLLSAKGYVGWIAGLGVSASILGLKGERSATPLAIAAGLASFSAVGFVSLQDFIDLTREQKVSTLGWSIGVFVIVALLIWFLSVRSNDAAVKEGQ